MPYVINFLMPIYGSTGAVLILSGVAMHAICCALLLQPVMWHVKKDPTKDADEILHDKLTEIECRYCTVQKRKARKSSSIFSSQFLFNVDDRNVAGYEIIDPGTPMLARHNDGWYSANSAKRSLYSSKWSLKYDSTLNSSHQSYVNLGNAAAGNSRKPKEVRVDDKIVEFPLDDVKGLNFTDQLPYHKNSSVGSFKNYKSTTATPTASRNSFVMPQITENQYLRDNHSVRSFARHPSVSRKRNAFNQEEQEVRFYRILKGVGSLGYF